MDLNSILAQTYGEYWSNLETILNKSIIVEQKLTYPLLINIFPEYQIAKVKLFIIGQQTRGWQIQIDGDPIKFLMGKYETFHLGENFSYSPFWLACHQLYQALNPQGSKYGFIWTNLVKIDQNKSRPCHQIENKICEAFPVLIKEIQISKPDVVVFFTGPNYDTRLKNTFPGSTLKTIEGYNLRTLARVSHKSLPINSFRTYHPVYIRRSKFLKLEDIINEITDNII